MITRAVGQAPRWAHYFGMEICVQNLRQLTAHSQLIRKRKLAEFLLGLDNRDVMWCDACGTVEYTSQGMQYLQQNGPVAVPTLSIIHHRLLVIQVASLRNYKRQENLGKGVASPWGFVHGTYKLRIWHPYIIMLVRRLPWQRTNRYRKGFRGSGICSGFNPSLTESPWR